MKILVVDDEALLVKGIRFNLQNEGYEVVTGSNGLEAVQLAADGDDGARFAWYMDTVLEEAMSILHVDADELIGATLFLCDDKAASAITGVVLPVDAGFAAYSGV